MSPSSSTSGRQRQQQPHQTQPGHQNVASSTSTHRQSSHPHTTSTTATHHLEPRPPISAASSRRTSNDVHASTATHSAESDQSPLVTSTTTALSAVTSFLEELKLSDIANHIKSRAGTAIPSDEKAIRRLVNSLTNRPPPSPPSSHAKDPTAGWSNDAAERSAVPVLQHILETDQYLPRHKIKELTQQLSATSPTFSTSSWLEGKSGYPRYRAPLARPLGRPDPPSPSSTSTSSASLNHGRKTSSATRIDTLGDASSPAPKSPASSGSWVGTSLANLARSDEYPPKPSGAKEYNVFDPTDQYRDDDDPGYRIRDLWEADLIEEIQARERNDPEAMRYPYYAAFVSAPSTNRKNRYPQYAAGGHPHHSDQHNQPITAASTSTTTTTATTTTTSDPSRSSTSPRTKMTDLASRMAGNQASQHQGTPMRRSSVSSHSSNYVLNSTPPRSSVMGQSSTQGSPLSRGGFDALNAASPSLQSEGNASSQRCSSPTFGLPSAPTVVDEDDELSGAASTTPTASFGALPATTDAIDHQPLQHQGFECAVTPPDDFSKDDSTPSPRPRNHQQSTNLLQASPQTQLPSPKSPVFGTEDVEDHQVSTSNDDADSHGNKSGKESLPSLATKDDKEQHGRPQASVSQDELALCSAADEPAPEAELGDFPSPPSPGCAPPDLEEEELDDQSASAAALADARRWRDNYCDGNSELHRQNKAQEKLSQSQNVLYPEPGDPEFPIIDENNKVIDCFNLKIIFERNKTGFEEYKDFQVKLGSVIAGRYVVESQLGQAAFSKALRCFDKKLKQHVCMKVIRNDKDYVDQSLDEIKLLRFINCNGDVDMVHCLRLYEFFYYKEHLIIVTEILKENLYEFSRKHREKGLNYFTIGRIQRVAAQVLIALQYVHSLRLIHSDLKPENILMKNHENCEIKVIDFGSSCFEDDLLSLYVQSRSYRAPEVLLGLPYDQKIDIWSLGCILAELWTGYVLFQNDSVAALLARIVGILGQLPYYMVCKGQTVSEHFTQDGQLFKVKTDEASCPRGGKRIRILLPKPSSLKQRMRTHDTAFVDFLTQLLQIDPAKRPSASEALRHPWLQPGRYSDGL